VKQNKKELALWSKFDDKYDSNPKILAAGRDAKNLHETAIRWSNGHLTDGKILMSALHAIGHTAQLPARVHQPAAARLVEVNLFEDRGDYWFIHDFFEYSPTRVKVEADRAAAKERMQQKRSPEVPTNNVVAEVGVFAKRSPSPSRPVPSIEDLAVFNDWAATIDRPRQFTPPRQRVIQARRREGYLQADLLDAAVGWQNDGWADRPQQNDLTILFRDGGQVEKFRDLQRNGRPVSGNKNQQAAAGWEAMGEHMKAIAE
jgi:hypothetical protein